MSIDKKAFGITEVYTPVDLDESMVSRYATQVVLGSKLKEMLDVEATAGLDTLNLTENPDDTQSEEPTTEEPVTEDTIVEDTTTEEPVVEEPVIGEPVTEDTQSADQEDTQSNNQEEITVDEETV